jgi:hypothetical protein
MNNKMKKLMRNATVFMAFALIAAGCQKMDRPALDDFPTDSNPPGGPLNFYAAFDGTTTNPLMNAVDSIRANFASQNPFTSIDGISGKAVQGVNKKTIKYGKPNDWAIQAKSFSIAFWYKRDGQTKNNTGGNGPEYIASFKSNNGHWSGSNLLLFLEGSNTACAVKVMIVDKNKADNWFTWEGGGSIPGLLDNKWHQATIVYDATSSAMTLFIDGVANTNKKVWGGHGNININHDAIVEMRVGAGPSDNIESDDWLASSWKGGLDQFRMYSTALTTSEIQALFNGKK